MDKNAAKTTFYRWFQMQKDISSFKVILDFKIYEKMLPRTIVCSPTGHFTISSWSSSRNSTALIKQTYFSKLLYTNGCTEQTFTFNRFIRP